MRKLTATPRTDSLTHWLEFISTQYPVEMELGLARVETVRAALGLKPTCPVITVAGTNGKGSTCALLESILSAAGHRVGCYTSPHLLHFNERIRVGQCAVSDAEIVLALARVNAAAAVPLTYFEFATLAAVDIFQRQAVDVIILEVGLGGRLDAVNVWDADCAIVTSIDLDHQAWLGDTREAIALEKAGIYRAARPAICADPHPPTTLVEYAQAIGAQWLAIGEAFHIKRHAQQWDYLGVRKRYALPFPALRGAVQLYNAAAVLTALDALYERLPTTVGDVRRGLLEVNLPARFQVLPGRPAVVLDVGHNPQAITQLLANLGQMGYFERTLAVFSMLADKDIAAVVDLLKDKIDHWHIAALDVPRAASASALQNYLNTSSVAGTVSVHPTITQAWLSAQTQATEHDRILVFGSFYTVAAVLAAREAAA